MALNPTAPGVYVQELNSFPPSVAPVSTAIPAFIGYTEKGPSSPTRITSILEYEATFGGPYQESYTANIDVNGNFTTVAPTSSESPYTLFYHIEMYFGNGGGPCYIISVDHYNSTVSLDPSMFYDLANPLIGIGRAEEVSEVTLLVAPEVIELSSASDIRSIYDAMLAQCDKLKNRFSILDLKVLAPSNPNPVADANAFRNTYVSANFLNYGAAYYPPIDTILHRSYSDGGVLINDLSGTYNTAPNNTLATINQGKGAFWTIGVAGTLGTGDSLNITVGGSSASFASNTTPPIYTTMAQVVDAVNQHPTISLLVRAQITSSTTFDIVERAASTVATTSLVVAAPGSGYTSLAGPFNGALNSANKALYLSIKNALAARVFTLPPSATMAGIYANVDNDRGVWKAPANVSVANIIGPSVTVTEAQQGNLNVDATSGKSINVIRAFTGRGTLVWGARTLDGNSNEWRYVPVRRLFIFAETSIKLACESMVFEPNDKNTWLTVKGLIGNFLNDLWRQGALAGDKPDQAYFVRVGLGETMTAQDILEGKMIVTIGMAAVRPAEFIILQFVQTLQQS